MSREKSFKERIYGICIFAVTFVMCCIGVLQISNTKSYAGTVGIVKTSGTSLNMRSGIGTNYSVVTSIPNGSKVTVVKKNAGTDSEGVKWHKISYNDKSGYASSKYITIQTTASATAAPSTSSSSSTYRTVTTTSSLKAPAKMRKKIKVNKNIGTKILYSNKKAVTLAKGSSVNVIKESTKSGVKWFKISFKYNKKTLKGFVKAVNVALKANKKTGAYVINVKSGLKVRKKASTKGAYVKVNSKNIVLPKKQYVTIIKEKKVGKTEWYYISFEYLSKTYKGYAQDKYLKLTGTKTTTKQAVTKLSSKEFETYMTNQGFPDSYKYYLRILHQKYPYWQFVAMKTGLDWNTVITKESAVGVNTISNSKSAAWKSKEAGAYDASTGTYIIQDGSTWVSASKAAVAYYMDPRNFMGDTGIYQFELLEYQSDYQNATGVSNILKNTPFSGSFQYTDDSGVTKALKYSTAFIDAAKQSKVSPYHLASRSKQEVVTGATTVSAAVTGTHSTYPGIYNFYNIGASDGSNALARGLKWASTGTTYLRPWNNQYKAIVGGGMYIGTNYINKGQNTGYLQKFNVTSTNTYNHQYMTNVEAASSEAIKTKNAYNGNLDSVPIVFSIPVYENMPSEPAPIPQ